MNRGGLVAAMVASILAVSTFGLGTMGALANGLVGARARVESLPSAPSSGDARMAAAMAVPNAVASITAAHLDNAGTAAKLSFDFAPGDLAPGGASFSPAAFVLANPDRVIVDLPQVEFSMNAERDEGQPGRQGKKSGLVKPGLISSYRFGLFAPGRSRVVIDLAGPARIVAAAIKKVGTAEKLVIELAKTDRAGFQAAARSRAVVAAKAPEVAPRLEPGKTTIVIDPGHGGPDNGAVVNGIVEKDVTLAFAKMLASKLESTGTFNVVMTRASDVFIPLSERVRVARGAEAALMISVHADTLPESTDVNGTTIYTVSDRASDAYAAKVAAKENDSDASVGVDGQTDTADVNDILFDLTRQETRAYSHVFARTLVNYWKVVGRLNKNPQRAAGFVVLKAPDVPSVLVELGYLSSPVDSAALTSDDWRDKATARMAEAIVAYFADRRGPAKAEAGVPLPLQQADLAVGLRK